MNRRGVLKWGGGMVAGGLLAAVAAHRFQLNPKAPVERSSMKMPIVFFGHGSPMNAIQDNAFTKRLTAIGKDLPRPKAILCISAHWMTEGTYVTGMEKPQTIHDFGGFPQELFAVQYPAPGSPEVAALVAKEITDPAVGIDANEWGLDHGTWSVLRHVFPKADVPILQLSLDMTQGPEYHLALGKQLNKLREQGVLIVGSGNIVHNLRRISWDPAAPAMDWAQEFDAWAKQKLDSRDFNALTKDYLSMTAGKLAVPTPDHYFPLLYVLGAADAKENMAYEWEEIQNGSISMRTISFGLRS